MRITRIAAAIMLLAGFAVTQNSIREATSAPAQDLLTAAQSDRSLAMFVTAVQSSGMAKMLREEGPFTVFALSNRAFANLPKEDRETLLTDRAAMHFLVAHYILRGTIAADDTARLQSARTLVGVKLRIDIRSEGSYVNGAKLGQADILCTNGVIHVLDSFDPGLVQDAVAMSKTSRMGK
jgi:uncharacterized surface protein with fasciclin (FAS1) repeats